jgi:hypothetical protein
MGIGGQFYQGLGSGFDQDIVEFGLSGTQKRAQFLRHGEDQVKVFDTEQLGSSSFQPDLGLLMMALGTAAVTAGVIGVVHPSTVIALKDMSTHPFRTAMNNIIHGPTMAGKHILPVLRSVLTTVAYENIRQFRHGRSPDVLQGLERGH